MKNWIIGYLLVPFKTIGLLFRLASQCRRWVNEILDHPRVQLAFKVAIAVTVLGWFVIWLFRDKYRDRLNEMIQGLY